MSGEEDDNDDEEDDVIGGGVEGKCRTTAAKKPSNFGRNCKTTVKSIFHVLNSSEKAT